MKSKLQTKKSFISSLKVIKVDSKIGGFFHGMNPSAAKELGVSYPYGMNTVAVIRGDPNEEWLIYHESLEYYLMKIKRLSYQEAHALTLLETKDVSSKKEGLLDAKKMMDWRKQISIF